MATRRIILFPLPFQGHINPMLQLASILHKQGGFVIIIVHTEYNSPNHSNYPHFTFKSIKDGCSKNVPTDADIITILNYLNKSCVDPFKKLVGELMMESPVACVITDVGFFFTRAVTDELKLPRLMLRTSSIACALAYSDLSLFLDKGYFNLTKNDSEYDAQVTEYPILKVKDIIGIILINSKRRAHIDNIIKKINEMKESSGIIWNTFMELEPPELDSMKKKYPIPHFTLGPFHKYFPSSLSSLIPEDQTILSWLDTQPPKSTIYVSFGSLACITESEFQQVAHALANISFPFLWVVRPGMVSGNSEWLESLPEKFLDIVGDRGRIVKWCPQQKVLAHPATGCFWTHNGWNSTLESICEGVPMLCSPCCFDQPINARYVSDVWKIGVLLEEFEMVGIETAIKRVMVDKGEEMRERISRLKEKLNLSLDEGGHSHQSLKSLVDHIRSF